MYNIDLVIPYVDSNDLNWQKLFNQYNPIKDNSIEGINAKNRFRGQGNFFKYWFRCVERNMPWIHNIFLVVQSESQVPSWINKDKVKIVLHKDIIPEEYLPTFNSTCIEMFLWNIPELSEYFIYSNDDFYALRPLRYEWFFNMEGHKVKNNSLDSRNADKLGMYSNHCINAYCLAFDKNKEELKNSSTRIPLFRHCMRPYLKSNMVKSFTKNKEIILNSISKFRELKNINIYYFDHCLIRDNYQEPRIGITNKCISSKTNYKDIIAILNSPYINMLAIQDTDIGDYDIYSNVTLNNFFREKYSFKSKYEI